MRSRLTATLLAWIMLLVLAGCASKPPADQTTETENQGQKTENQKAPGGLMSHLTSKPVTLPAGTVITVKMGQAVGSKISNSGDAFAASVAEPVEVDGKVVIPSGADASGVVNEAAPLGRFKGGARLKLTLDSVTINGTKYPVETESVVRSEKGKGKRTAVMAGGGAGAGALIGGLAGGGKGALIGALVGGGAGTAGAAFTGNKNIVVPAESALSFKLLQPIEVKM